MGGCGEAQVFHNLHQKGRESACEVGEGVTGIKKNLWSTCDILQPGQLSVRDSFLPAHCTPPSSGQLRDLQQAADISEIAKSYPLVRRTGRQQFHTRLLN